MTMTRLFRLATCAVSMLTFNNSLSAQSQVLDNFSSGNIIVDHSVTSTFGDPVPGVFGGNRAILLSKQNEASPTSIQVGSGVLTWNGSAGDYGHVGYGTATTSADLSAYNAFRITVISAPQNPGQLEVNLGYRGSPTQLYGVWALADLPASGIVDIPFSSFGVPQSFPPIDLTQIHDIGLTFRGNLLSAGTLVLDNFQVTTVPEPGTFAIMAIGVLGFGFIRARMRRRIALP
jgi:hypothetical protein